MDERGDRIFLWMERRPSEETEGQEGVAATDLAAPAIFLEKGQKEERKKKWGYPRNYLRFFFVSCCTLSIL